MTKAKREREEMEAKRRGEDAIKAAREARAARKFALGKGTAKDPEAKSDGASTWSWWWFWAGASSPSSCTQCDDALDTLRTTTSSVLSVLWADQLCPGSNAGYELKVLP